jgi:hypothetical protein
VLLHDVLDLLLLQVLQLVLLEVKTNLGTMAKGRVDGIGGDGERATGRGLPDVLVIVIVFRDDLHTLGDEVREVETDTELTDHGNVSTGAQSLHEALNIER